MHINFEVNFKNYINSLDLNSIEKDDLLKLIENSIAKQPLNILLTTYNVTNGMGDFVKMLIYFDWLKTGVSRTNHTKVKSICFVDTNCLEIAKKIIADKYSFFIFNADKKNPQTKIDENYDILIITASLERRPSFSFTDYANQHKNLAHFYKKADLLVNISTPLDTKCNNPFLLIKSTCQVHVVGEFGSPYINNFDQCPEYRDRYSMMRTGMKYETDDFEHGIEFDDELLNFSKESSTNPEATLTSISDKKLLQCLLKQNEQETSYGLDNYLKTTLIVCDYLKKNNIRSVFYMLISILALRKSLNTIDIFTNKIEIEKLCFLDVTKSIEIYDESFSRIKIINRDSGTLKLRIFNYKLLISTDIKKIKSVCHILSCSGDISWSELMSTDAFAFFPMPPWKLAFLYDLRLYVDHLITQNSSLKDYFAHFREYIFYIISMSCPPENMIKAKNNEYDYQNIDKAFFDKFIDLVTNHYQQIYDAWRYLKDELFNNKNVKPITLDWLHLLLLKAIIMKENGKKILNNFQSLDDQLNKKLIIYKKQSLSKEGNLSTTAIYMCGQNKEKEDLKFKLDLLRIIRTDNVDEFKKLITDKIFFNVNTRLGKHQSTLAHLMVQADAIRCLEYLLTFSQVKLDLLDANNKRVIDFATTNNDEKCKELFLKYKSNGYSNNPVILHLPIELNKVNYFSNPSEIKDSESYCEPNKEQTGRLSNA